MSFAQTALLWLRRLLMLPVALMGFIFALQLEALLTWSGIGNPPPCYLSGQVCWGEAFWGALAYALGAVIFVMLPVILEPKEKFSVAVIFYGIGTLVVILGITIFNSLGLLRLWSMIFPPLIVGLGCVLRVRRVWGYGSAAQFFSASSPGSSQAARRWLVLRRVLIIPLVLACVFAAIKLESAIEDRLFALCPPAAYYPGTDSVPESCSDIRIERLQTLNDYTAIALPLALAIFLAALLEPHHKSLTARLMWLVGSGFLVFLTPLFVFTFWRHTALAFVVGAMCVWIVGRIYPTKPAEGSRKASPSPERLG